MVNGFVLWCLVTASMPAVAADAAQSRCRALAEPRERLACWDQMYPPTASEPMAVIDAQAAFGLSAGERLKREGRLDEVPDRLSLTITAVSIAAEGRRQVTLDNGQLWLLPPATIRDRVAAGDQIEIRTAALGSFLLRTQAGVDVRARRVR